jgi:hypothetical protein
MILHGQLCGNVGRRQDKNKRPKQPQTASAFFVLYPEKYLAGLRYSLGLNELLDVL